MDNVYLYTKEGANKILDFVLGEDTTNESVTARIKLQSDSGDGQNVGTTIGVAAGVKNSINLLILTYTPGDYLLELVADLGGINQRVVNPNPNELTILRIENVFTELPQ